MITAIVIPADPAEPIQLEQLDEHDPDAYRRMVEGSLTAIGLDRPPAVLCTNAGGKPLGMLVNSRATALLRAHRRVFRSHHVIAGPAFIVGRPDFEDVDTSAPQDLVDLLINTKRYRVQVMAQDDTTWVGDQRVFTDWLEAYTYGARLAQSWMLIVRVVPVLDDELLETWYRIGLDNRAIRMADDPPFTKGRFVGTYSIEELAERINENPWAIGTPFYYRDLCFIQQASGGDEWLAIRHGIVLGSVALTSCIEDEMFASLVHQLLAAPQEQLERREY